MAPPRLAHHPPLGPPTHPHTPTHKPTHAHQPTHAPAHAASQVAAEFTAQASSSNGTGGPVLLAVRSSANVEDLAGMSAAGLYESKVRVCVCV